METQREPALSLRDCRLSAATKARERVQRETAGCRLYSVFLPGMHLAVATPTVRQSTGAAMWIA